MKQQVAVGKLPNSFFFLKFKAPYFHGVNPSSIFSVSKCIHDEAEEILYTECVLIFTIEGVLGQRNTQRFSGKISLVASRLLRYAVIQLRLHGDWTHDKSSHYLAERAGWLREWMGQFQRMRSVVVVVTLFGSDEDYASQKSNTVRMIVDLVSILRRIPTLEIRNDGNFTTPVWAQIVQLATEEVQGWKKAESIDI